MSRIGSRVSANEVFEINGKPDPWRTLLLADQTEPGRWEARGPRCLRLWAGRGFQGPTKGYRARITFGAGDISTAFQIGDPAGNLAFVPTQGLALPMPEATSVRIDVAFPVGALLPPDPGTDIFGSITHGAPVLTWMGGTLLLAQAAAVSLTFDPQDYPFAVFLKVTNVGPVLGATVAFGGGGPFQMPINSTFDFPFMSTITLTSVLGSGILYSIGIIS